MEMGLNRHSVSHIVKTGSTLKNMKGNPVITAPEGVSNRSVGMQSMET